MKKSPVIPESSATRVMADMLMSLRFMENKIIPYSIWRVGLFSRTFLKKGNFFL